MSLHMLSHKHLRECSLALLAQENILVHRDTFKIIIIFLNNIYFHYIHTPSLFITKK